jgi:hypothetical protein
MNVLHIAHPCRAKSYLSVITGIATMQECSGVDDDYMEDAGPSA